MTHARGTIRPTELNVARRRLAIKELDRLLETAADHRFTGTVSITVAAKEGRLGQPRLATDRFADVDR